MLINPACSKCFDLGLAQSVRISRAYEHRAMKEPTKSGADPVRHGDGHDGLHAPEQALGLGRSVDARAGPVFHSAASCNKCFAARFRSQR